jgi:hypothetical protein
VRFSQDVEVKEFFNKLDGEEAEGASELLSKKDTVSIHKIKFNDLEDEDDESILHKRTFSESVGEKFKD